MGVVSMAGNQFFERLSLWLMDPALYPVLDLCFECKACKTECPTGVDMARIKSEFLHQYQKKNGGQISETFERRARYVILRHIVT